MIFTSKTWKMTEGTVLCCCLLLAGLVLQLFIGPVDWGMFAFPANIITVVLFCLISVVIYTLSFKTRLFRFLRTAYAAVPTLIFVTVLMVVMGLIRQDNSVFEQQDALGLNTMVTFWPFVLICFWLAILLSQAIIAHTIHFHWRMIPFIFLHFGLLIILISASLGSADRQQFNLNVSADRAEQYGFDVNGNLIKLPFSIRLMSVSVDGNVAENTHGVDSQSEKMSASMPSRVSTRLQINTSDGLKTETAIAVNKPFSFKGWRIYLFSYDSGQWNGIPVCVLQAVKDSWLPAVFTGIYMLLAGALGMLFLAPMRRKETER
jgi:hypothetical protein